MSNISLLNLDQTHKTLTFNRLDMGDYQLLTLQGYKPLKCVVIITLPLALDPNFVSFQIFPNGNIPAFNMFVDKTTNTAYIKDAYLNQLEAT